MMINCLILDYYFFSLTEGPNQPDGSGHVYFNPNYSAQVAYVPGAAGYVAPQPSPQQGNPYAAVYAAYVPGSTGTQASPIVASPGQVPNAQYYMHPSGSIVCVPRQVLLFFFWTSSDLLV